MGKLTILRKHQRKSTGRVGRGGPSDINNKSALQRRGMRNNVNNSNDSWDCNRPDRRTHLDHDQLKRKKSIKEWMRFLDRFLAVEVETKREKSQRRRQRDRIDGFEGA